MTLLVTVETGGMTQVLASRAGNIGGMVIGGWEGTRVFQARSCSPCQQFEWDGVRIECGSRGVPRYQVSPDMHNRNYEARVTSPILLHHSGEQVEAVVYHQRAEPAALSKPCISSSHHDDFE